MEATEPLDIANLLMPVALIIFIVAIGVVLLYQHFQKNLLQQKVREKELKNEHQSELLKSNITAQETERKRIAQDIHDELGATLSITRMHLLQLEKSSYLETKAKQSVQNIRKITETALASMRKISHQLMPPLLESFGLFKTLEEFTDQINQTHELRVTLAFNEGPECLSHEIELGLYRICLELIHNTLKHAAAQHITITLSYEDGPTCTLLYADDGKGMISEHTNGLGLTSIEARTQALEGLFEILPGPGFQAKVTIPNKPENDE